MGFTWIMIFSIISLSLLPNTNSKFICRPFDSIYHIGDSISDTGNSIKLSTNPALPAASLPFGQTLRGQATGRWSDGLLISDYVARAIGLPLLNPYLERNASFTNGVNFAVAGSTALDIPFLTERGVQVSNTTTAPLSLQLNWFRTHLNSICSTPKECQAKLRRALVILGVLGSNDIILSLTQGKSVREVREYAPFIAEAIAKGTREAISLGAIRIVIPGVFPLGCLPLFVNGTFPANNRTIDEFGCLSDVNDLSVLLNNNTRQRLNLLRKEFPNVNIMYADNYNTYLTVLRRAAFFGFDPNTLLKNCCGVGGSSDNSGANHFCGSPGAPLCQNPDRYISWDGIHFTQEAHRRFSKILIPSIRAKIPCFQ